MKKLSADADAAHQLIKLTRVQIRHALHKLERRRLDDEALHCVRKSLKRGRAGLRLLRPGLPETEYRKANGALRDAARPLGGLRDANVLQDTLTQLLARPQRRGPPVELAALTRMLRQHRKAMRQQVLHDGRVLAHSRHLLREALARTAGWKLRKSNWKLLGPALEHIYRKARRARAVASATGTPHSLHEWRKQVKYLHYALQILRPVWPAMVGALAQQTHELSDELGDSHDLAVLCATSIAHPDLLEAPGNLNTLLGLTEHRQQILTHEASLLGARLFEDKPRAFAGRLGHYWRDWRHSQLSTGAA
ncbi:MAG TPA: CHAD domain-containing protein [Steroidobacteraceae bacterium]|jgi:CHAD domain-containing protein